MMTALRCWLQKRWYGRYPVFLALPLAGVYGLVVAVRRRLYRRGWLASQTVGLPVLVVGNISVGGSGKTPLTLAIVRQAQALGWHPGVIMRGYGGKAPHYPLAVYANTDPAQAGDEAVLLAQRSQVPIVVAPDRVAAGRHLAASGMVDLIIADDGLQHYRLQRDAEIVVRDGRRGYGNGCLLPAGPLREPVARARLADMECKQGQDGDFWLEPGQIWRLLDGQGRDWSDWIGQTVHAVAGIGDPERFFAMLRAKGLKVIAHPGADHRRYRIGDLDFSDDRPILMTEKDAVKCQAIAHARCWAVPVQTRLTAHCADRIDQLLRQLPSPDRHGDISCLEKEQP